MGPQYPYHPLINPSGHKQTNNLSNNNSHQVNQKPKYSTSANIDKDYLANLEKLAYKNEISQSQPRNYQEGGDLNDYINNNLNNNNMNLPNFRSRMQNNPSYLPNFMQMGGEQSPQDQMQDQQMQQAPQEGGGVDPQQMAQQIVQEFQQLPPDLQQAVMQALMGQSGGGQQQDPQAQPQQKMGGYNNLGFRNLPQHVQEKIMRNS